MVSVPGGGGTVASGGAGDAALTSLLGLQPWAVDGAAAGLSRTSEGLADAAHVLDGYEPRWRGEACLAARGARDRRGEALRTASGAFHEAGVALRGHAELVGSVWLRAQVIARDVGAYEVAGAGGAGPEAVAGRAVLLREAAAGAEAVAASGRAAALVLGAAAGVAPRPGRWEGFVEADARVVDSLFYGMGEVAADAANLLHGVSSMGAGLAARTLGTPLTEQERDADVVYRRRTAQAWEVARDDPAAVALAVVNLPLLRSDPARWVGNLGPGGGSRLVGVVGAAAGGGARAAGALAVAGRGGAVSVAGAAREGAAVFARERRAALAARPLPPGARREGAGVAGPRQPPVPPHLPGAVPAVVAVPASVAVSVAVSAARRGSEAVTGGVERSSRAARVAVSTVGGVGRTAHGAVRASAGRVAGAGAAGDARRAMVSATSGAADALRRAGLAVTQDVGRVVVHLEEVSWTQGLLALEVLGRVAEGQGGVGAMVGGLVGRTVGGGDARGWTLRTASGVELAWPVRPSPLAATAVATARLQLRRTAEVLARTHVAGAGVVVGGWSVSRLGQGVVVAQRLGLLPSGGVRETLVWTEGAADTVAGAGGLAARNAREERAAVVRDAERFERELVLREAAAATGAAGGGALGAPGGRGDLVGVA